MNIEKLLQDTKYMREDYRFKYWLGRHDCDICKMQFFNRFQKKMYIREMKRIK